MLLNALKDNHFIYKQQMKALANEKRGNPLFSAQTPKHPNKHCWDQVCRSFFVLLLLAIVLSVRRYTDSDYPFGIFKLFFRHILFPNIC